MFFVRFFVFMILVSVFACAARPTGLPKVAEPKLAQSTPAGSSVEEPVSQSFGVQENGKPSMNKLNDQLVIEDLVKEKFAEIRRCYENALVSSPHLKGTMTIDFVIDDKGIVSEEKSSGIKHSSFENCVLGKFSEMVFPKLAIEEKLAVRYPLVFAQ